MRSQNPSGVAPSSMASGHVESMQPVHRRSRAAGPALVLVFLPVSGTQAEWSFGQVGADDDGAGSVAVVGRLRGQPLFEGRLGAPAVPGVAEPTAEVARPGGGWASRADTARFEEATHAGQRDRVVEEPGAAHPVSARGEPVGVMPLAQAGTRDPLPRSFAVGDPASPGVDGMIAWEVDDVVVVERIERGCL
jgi:hypothetical protein